MTDYNPSGLIRALVLAGPVLALLTTMFCLVTGSGLRLLGSIWFVAALWTFLAVLAHVLWQGFHRGDWSGLNRYEFPEGNSERFDWAKRTDRYAWLRDLEEQELHGHDLGALVRGRRFPAGVG